MADQFTYQRGDLSITPGTNSAYNNQAAGNGGGGGGNGGNGSSSSNSSYNPAVVFNNPTTRAISFSISSSPQGASILIDGVSSGFTTPHTLSFTETELLNSKTISLLNGSSKSVETYILSSQIITTELGTGNSSGGSGGGGNSYGGGYSGGGYNPYEFNPGDPNSNNANYVGDRPTQNQK